MTIEQKPIAGPSDTAATIANIIIVFTVAALVAGALSIPFFFQSSSIQYKFGIDRVLLRSGKMVGLAAMLLIVFQLVLAGRIRMMDRLYGLPALYRIHRTSAMLLLILALAHPVLVFVPDGIWMIPFEAKYWPEWVGAVLLLMIVSQVILTKWKGLLWRTYEQWRLFHRIAGATAVILAGVHVLYVSDTFEFEGLPRNAVFAAIGGYVLIWLWIRFQGLRVRKFPFIVKQVDAVSQDAHAVTLEPTANGRMAYWPGQFVFIEFDSGQLAGQAHPFTLSSAPTRPQAVQLTIRSCGDWTDRIGTLRPGDKAFVQGPFGRFSHVLDQPQQEIVMIAGGIGITPMLSMLRFMADNDEQRRITLIWSNRNRLRLFGADELDAIAQKLTSFRWIPIFTRDNVAGAVNGRLDRSRLESLLETTSRTATIYLCGPPAMIAHIHKCLRQAGFPAGSIKLEAFDL